MTLFLIWPFAIVSLLIFKAYTIHALRLWFGSCHVVLIFLELAPTYKILY
jgi:hypothetical protein